MSKPAAMPVFGDAYIADTRHLTLEEHGAYWLLLLIAWRSPDCSLPDDDKRLAQMLGTSTAKWAKLKPVIMEFWTLKGGRWSQKRQQKEHAFVTEKREKNSQAAKSRWNGQAIENNRGEGSERTSGRTSKRISQNDAPPPPPSKETPTPSSVSARETALPKDVRRLLEEGGFVSPPPDISLLSEWYGEAKRMFDQGPEQTLEQDILPTVRAVRARLSKAPFKLKVFDGAIREHLAKEAADLETLRRNRVRWERIAEEEAAERQAASGG